MKKLTLVEEMFGECVLYAEGYGWDKAQLEVGEIDEVAIKRHRSTLRGMKKMLKIACKHTDVDYNELKTKLKEVEDKSYEKEISKLKGIK